MNSVFLSVTTEQMLVDPSGTTLELFDYSEKTFAVLIHLI